MIDGPSGGAAVIHADRPGVWLAPPHGDQLAGVAQHPVQFGRLVAVQIEQALHVPFGDDLDVARRGGEGVDADPPGRGLAEDLVDVPVTEQAVTHRSPPRSSHGASHGQ